MEKRAGGWVGAQVIAEGSEEVMEAASGKVTRVGWVVAVTGVGKPVVVMGVG